MNEVKRKATARYFEQEIWNNLSKQNSFEDRRLNLKYNKLGKDESITVKSWNQEQLLMLRRNKKLHDLLNGSHEHCPAQRSDQLIPQSRYLSLPTLATQRPHSTAACTRGTTGLSSRSNEPTRPRSHTDNTSLRTGLSVKQSVQEEICLPAVQSGSKVRRSSHSACSQGTSVSNSELSSKQRKTSWTRPSTQLHQRVNLTSLCD